MGSHGLEWAGQRVENTNWRREAKEQLRAMEKAVERVGGARCRDRDEAFEKGWNWEKRSPWLLALFGHPLTLYE